MHECLPQIDKGSDIGRVGGHRLQQGFNSGLEISELKSAETEQAKSLGMTRLLSQDTPASIDAVMRFFSALCFLRLRQQLLDAQARPEFYSSQFPIPVGRPT